jgi:hypothetical protein
MLLAACEGRHSRYEVLEHSDGYLVQMRDLETGDLDEHYATVFRTMPVAFAYAEMSAALDRYVAGSGEAADDEESEADLEARERNFISLCNRLRDTGLNGGTVRAWERFGLAGTRRGLH